MGLSIVALRDGILSCHDTELYSQMHDDDSELDDISDLHDDLIEIFGGDFPEHLDGLMPGIYRFEPRQSFEFHVGPYSRYNWWRDLLSFMIYGADASTVYMNSEKYQDNSFIELICFSDSQGAIGPRTSAKLFSDFELHKEQASQLAEEGFLELYSHFSTAFSVARHNGFVVFT